MFSCNPQKLSANVYLIKILKTLQTNHVDSTLKRRGNGRFHVVSTWNPRGVFVGKYVENLFNLELSAIFHINNFLYSKIPNTIC